MALSKLLTFRQYHLLQIDQKQVKNYLNFRYKFRFIVFLCISFLFVHVVINTLAVNILRNDKPVNEAIADVDYFSNLQNFSHPIDYEKYIIYTPQCVIPRIPAFAEKTKKVLWRYNNREYQCPEADSTAGIKRVNYTWVQIPEGMTCMAWEIERDAGPESGKYGRSFQFGDRTIMNFPDSDAVEVSCKGMNTRKAILLIPKKKPIWRAESLPKPNQQNRPNILAIGIDSLSRLNFLRHFTETHKFITANRFEGPMYGHHKVGDNTFPNLIAMLTGLTESSIKKSLPKSLKLDGIPLIFKSFSAAGYMTTFIEDLPKVGLWTFHEKNGFSKQPIEYMQRPLNILVDGQLQRWFCYKEKLEMELYYDYVYDQMRAFRERDQRFLTFTHMAALTHDELNLAQFADLPVYRFLKRIFDANLNNNTVILFYADHGMRFGKILEIESGYHESRMPVMFVYIPENLKLKDSNRKWINSEQIREILKVNSRRLTSQFDIHATLRHILNEVPPEDELYGRSFFTPSPLNRTCEDAGIPNEYCLCRTLVSFTDSQSLTLLADHVLEHLNKKLKVFSSKCEPIKLAKVLKGKISLEHSRKDTKAVNKQLFTIKIQLKPSNGIIETTLKATVTNGQITDKKSIEIAGTILRLDRYGEQSKCVANTPVESFCYCRNLSKNKINTN